MPVYEDEFGFLSWQAEMRGAAQVAQQAADPAIARNIKVLMREFPWLRPGVAHVLAQRFDFLTGTLGDARGEPPAWQIALADLYYQANETDRFGNTKQVDSPVERLAAWEKELAGYIKKNRKREAAIAQDMRDNPGESRRDAVAGLDPELAQGGRMGRQAQFFPGISTQDIKALRRTARFALLSGDPVTINAVLGEINQAAQGSRDPYDMAKPNTNEKIVRAVTNASEAAYKWVRESQQKADAQGLSAPTFAPAVAGVPSGVGVAAQNAAQVALDRGAKGLVRNTAMVLNSGIEGLTAIEREIVSSIRDPLVAAWNKANPLGVIAGQSSGQNYGEALVNPKTVWTTPPTPGEAADFSPWSIASQAQVGQAAKALLTGMRVDTGTGWLPDLDSQTAQDAAEQSRLHSPWLINGHAWTPGRGTADVLGLDPDTPAFTLVSGGIDFTQAFLLDPANFAIAGLAEANRARRLFDLDEAGNIVSRVRNLEDQFSALDDIERGADTVAGWAIRDVEWQAGKAKIFSTREAAQEFVDAARQGAVEEIRVPRTYFDPPTAAERALGVEVSPTGYSRTGSPDGLPVFVTGRPLPSSVGRTVETRALSESARIKAWMTADGTLYENVVDAPPNARPVYVDRELFAGAQGADTGRVTKVDPKRIQIAQGPDNIPSAASNLPPLAHGSPYPLTGQPEAEFSSLESLYGPGFHTSDNFAIPDEYMQKTFGLDPSRPREPRKYWVEWLGDEPPRVLDLEGELPEDVAARASEWIARELPPGPAAVPLQWIGNRTVPGAPQAPAGEFIKSVIRAIDRQAERQFGKSIVERNALNTTQAFDGYRAEMIRRFRDEVLGPDFDVMRYDGGKRLGSIAGEHNAYVWIKEKNIRANRIEEGSEFVEREAMRGIVRDGKVVTRADLLREAGVGIDRKPFIKGQNPIDWLYTKGEAFVKALAGESDPWTIYWALNGKIPIRSDTGQNVLEALANAKTESEVRIILSSELGTTIKRVPKYRQGLTLESRPRALYDMPTRVVNVKDPNGTAHTIINYLKLSKVPEATQQRIFNQFVEAHGRGDDYAAIDAVWDAVKAQVEAAKPRTNIDIEDFFRRVRNEWDTASLYGVNGDTGASRPLRLPDGNGGFVDVPGPRWVRERFNSSVILPDPQQVRRFVASKGWNRAVNSDMWAGSIWLADAANDMWKFLVLMRGAWPIRVIGDEMLRMAATGQSPFLHPISYLANVLGNPNEGKLLTWLELIGRDPSPELLARVREDRSARLADLLAQGESTEDALRLVNREMPVPRRLGEEWSARVQQFKTDKMRYQTDIAGATWDPNDLYGEALTSRMMRDRSTGRQVYLGHFEAVNRESEYWSRGLVEELYRIHSEEVTRRALNMGTDDFLNGLWSEQWGVYARQQMAAGRADGDPWLRVLADREASDAYGREILNQLQDFHRGDQDLIDAMRTGNLTVGDETVRLGYGGHPNPDAVKFGKVLQDEGRGPEFVKLQRMHMKMLNKNDRDAAIFDNFVSGAFDFLMTKPSNYLTRSPTFRQAYWDNVEQLIPSLNAEAQARLRANLSRARVAKDQEARILAKLDSAGTGELRFQQADDILKRRALDYTRGLLYDLHKRSQFFDAARLVFPFGEAWKEVLQTWTRILADYPNDLRRIQQGIQGAQTAEIDPVTGLPTGEGEGMIRTDPQTGKQVFTYPFSGWLSQQQIKLPVNIPVLGDKLGAGMPIPIPMRGAASSLNMILQGVPGLGFVAQVPLSQVIPDEAGFDGLKNVLFPYGEPEGNNLFDKLVNQFKPNWVRKAEIASTDPRYDRVKGNMVFDVMAVLASTGEYDIANSENAQGELLRLYNDAKEKAKQLGWLRGAGAFLFPASPGFDYYAEDKTGNLVMLQQLRDEYSEKRDKFYKDGVQNASAEAFRWFLRKYGPDNIFATQSKSHSNVVGLEPTIEQRDFVRKNEDAVTMFPQTWALFAPADGKYDYNVYLQQLEANFRDPLQPTEMAKEAINRRAEHVYQKERKKFPDVLSRQQSAAFDKFRRDLAVQFPGATPGTYGGNENYAAQMAELEVASRPDSPVGDTELAKALRIYFEARDKVNRIALNDPKGSSSSARQSKETSGLRSSLRSLADELAMEYDGFGRAYDYVLSREFASKD